MSRRAETFTLGLLLGRLERLNEQLTTEVCGRHATTPAELRVLAFLVLGADGAPTSPSRIAERIVQTSGGLTATLARLEKAGHVSRLTDPADGRGRLVAITASGRAFADAALADLDAEYGACFDAVEAAELLAAVRTLVEVLERRSDEAPTGDWTAPDRPLRSTA